MDALTPAERRGALLLVMLLALGAGHDLLQALRPGSAPARSVKPVAGAAGVPGREGGGEGVGERAAGPPVAMALDLNRASPRELESLPGVGPVLAERIVDHRDRHGPFRDAEELLAVRGIGRRLLARLRPHVTIGSAAVPPAPAGARPRSDGG